MLDAVMFDLDGTLLPMDYDVFTKGYFKLLAKAAEPHGYPPRELIGAMWAGVAKMVNNTGAESNHDAFWREFSKYFGEKVYNDIQYFDAFYSNEFHKAVEFVSPTPLAKEAVNLAKEKAGKVILATNPLFPRVAVTSRLQWCGLSEDDFDYITDYSNSSFCKPNPSYFKEIADKNSIDLSNCLMIGNNMQEDIVASQRAGADTYLITDCLIDEGESAETKKGSFFELLDYLKNLG